MILIKDSILWIVIVQLVLASITVWLTSKLGTMLFNKATGVIVGLLLTFYGGYVYFIAIPHTAILEVFLATLSLYLLYILREKFLWQNAFYFGIVSALLCLIRPNYLVICLPVAAAISLEFYLKHKIKLWPLYFYVLVYLLTIIAFFIIGRFRLTAVPAMLIPGAAFIAYIIEIISRRMISKIKPDEKMRVVIACVIFIGVFIFSEPWETVYTVNSWRMLSRQYFLNLDLKEYKYCQAKLLQFKMDHYFVKL